MGIGDNLPDGTWPGDPSAPWNQEDYEEEYEEDGEEYVPPQGFELTPMEKLAVAQALYKAVGEVVGTKSATNLRAKVDADIRELWREQAARGYAPKSFDVELFGEKVGTYSITAHPAEPASMRMELEVENRAQLAEWALPRGFAKVDMGKVQQHFEDTGEVPPGCAAIPVHVPPREAGIDRTSLRIDPQKVAERMGRGLLGREAQLMLEGGE